MLTLSLALALAVQEPPARFDHPVKNMAVMYAPKSDVHGLCRFALKYRGRGKILGCAFPVAGGCMVIVPRGTAQDSLLFRHEQAHCAGWPADHPA